MSRVAVELVFSILVGTLQRVKTPLSYSLFAQSRKKKKNNIEKDGVCGPKLQRESYEKAEIMRKTGAKVRNDEAQGSADPRQKS